MINNPIIIQKILISYKSWQIFQKNIPKIHRYSIGIKIDNYYTNILESIYTAYISDKKILYIEKTITLNNVLKNMLYTLLEIKGISDEQYLNLNKELEEVSKMLYTWKIKTINTNNVNGKYKSV